MAANETAVPLTLLRRSARTFNQGRRQYRRVCGTFGSEEIIIDHFVIAGINFSSTSTQIRPLFTSSNLAQFFCSKMMWFELTFILPSMLFEHWEKILLLTISAVLFVLVFTSMLKYLHRYLVVMRGRPAWGQVDDERDLWQWIGLASGEGGTLNSYNNEG